MLSPFCDYFRRRIEKLERVSLALIRLAYTSVPEGKREASTFRLERSHPVAAIADMEDVPVLTASIRFAIMPSENRNIMMRNICIRLCGLFPMQNGNCNMLYS